MLLIFFSICPQLFAEQTAAGKQNDFFDMSMEELMDVEVTLASKKPEKMSETPAAIYVITAEDIRRSGHQSIPELLRMVPGIQVAKIDSNKWAITARGFNSLYANKLLVLIDGRTVYTPLYSGVYWDVQDVLLEDVERIEVIRGPGGTLWGANVVNGIINIITKNAKDTQGTLVTGGIGTEEKSFSSIRYGDKLGKDAYYRAYAKYFNRDEGVYTDGSNANDRCDALREGFRIDWDKSKQDHITLQGDFYNGHSGQNTTRTSLSSPFTTTFDDNVDVSGWNILSRWKRKYSDTSDMTVQFYYDRTERYAENLSETRDTFDLDFQHRFQLCDGHNLIWGLGYRNSGDNTDGSYTISYTPSSRNDELFTAFAQDEISIVDGLLKFIIGSKFEKNDYTGFEYQPSARLLWTPDERNTVWAAFTRAVSTPSRCAANMRLNYLVVNPVTAFSINGSDDLRSQKVNSYELGYRVKPKDNLFFDIAAFYNKYDDLYSQENHPTALTKVYDNKIYGETYGGELSAHWQVKQNWKLMAGYSFSKMLMHTENSSTDTSREARIERESPHNMFHIGSYLNLQKNLDFDTMLYYVESVPYYSVPAYIRLDMGITWRINKNMGFSVVGQNLLDKAHPEFGDDSVTTAETQRAVFGKLTYRF